MSERIRIIKRRWWWVAWNPDEPVATFDTPTYLRSRSRERLIEKARRRWGSKPVEWEEVALGEADDE